MKIINRKFFALYFSMLSSTLIFLSGSPLAYPYFIKTDTHPAVQFNQNDLKLSLQLPRTMVSHPFPYERVKTPRAIQPNDTTTALPRMEIHETIPIQPQLLPKLEVEPTSEMTNLQEIKKKDIHLQRELKPLPQ